MSNDGFVACSAMIKPVRVFIKDSIVTWIERIVKLPTHTFVVEEAKIPLDLNNLDGYWYCAGQFCDVDEAGVHQYLGEGDIQFARCLVAPNIKDDDPRRPTMVIEGEYSVHYVCHNITNRVLYATRDKLTLGDIEIPKNGYTAVVKTPLGVYGQNKVEWKRRKQKCSLNSDDEYSLSQNAPINIGPSACNDEIEKLHLAACKGDKTKASNLTIALRYIDAEFFNSTEEAIQLYCNKEVDFKMYNQLMINACSLLFSKTISTVGRKMAQEIYPGCDLDIKYEDMHQPPQEYMFACG